MVRVGGEGAREGGLCLGVFPGLQVSFCRQRVQGVNAVSVRGAAEGHGDLLEGGVRASADDVGAGEALATRGDGPGVRPAVPRRRRARPAAQLQHLGEDAAGLGVTFPKTKAFIMYIYS